MLKTGDCVTMNDRYAVAEENKGKVFAVLENQRPVRDIQMAVIEGWPGGYPVDGLTKIEGNNGKCI